MNPHEAHRLCTGIVFEMTFGTLCTCSADFHFVFHSLWHLHYSWGSVFFPSTNLLHDIEKKPCIARLNEFFWNREPHTTTKASIWKDSKILAFNYLNSKIGKTTILLHHRTPHKWCEKVLYCITNIGLWKQLESQSLLQINKMLG